MLVRIAAGARLDLRISALGFRFAGYIVVKRIVRRSVYRSERGEEGGRDPSHGSFRGLCLSIFLLEQMGTQEMSGAGPQPILPGARRFPNFCSLG